MLVDIEARIMAVKALPVCAVVAAVPSILWAVGATYACIVNGIKETLKTRFDSSWRAYIGYRHGKSDPSCYSFHYDLLI